MIAPCAPEAQNAQNVRRRSESDRMSLRRVHFFIFFLLEFKFSASIRSGFKIFSFFLRFSFINVFFYSEFHKFLNIFVFRFFSSEFHKFLKIFSFFIRFSFIKVFFSSEFHKFSFLLKKNSFQQLLTAFKQQNFQTKISNYFGRNLCLN